MDKDIKKEVPVEEKKPEIEVKAKPKRPQQTFLDECAG